MAMGRPPSGKYNIPEMIKKITEYTDTEAIPILKEVCYLNHWPYDYVMKLQREDEDLKHSIKRLLCKKEVQLEKGALKGVIDKTMAIFSLKQLGWRDVVESDQADDKVVIVDDFRA